MTLYDNLVFLHILLFVFWLGADLGVFLLGQKFRDTALPLDHRLTLLKMLVMTDMGPRTSWALMVPVSLALASVGDWWPLPGWALLAAWAVGGVWLYLVWTAYLHDQTPRAARLRRIEFWLKLVLTAFYLGLGGLSLTTGAPLAPDWLAAKALLFGLIFAFAIMIDVAFKPLGPALGTLIEQGSKPETERPVRAVMDRTRLWVTSLYILLLITGWLGTVKPGL